MANPATGCRCGSGGHPRRCALHPFAYDVHIADMNFYDSLYGDEEPIADIAELRRLYEVLEKADWANLRHRCEEEDKLTLDRDYWQSRALALETDRRNFLPERGIDLGERPAIDGSPPLPADPVAAPNLSLRRHMSLWWRQIRTPSWAALTLFHAAFTVGLLDNTNHALRRLGMVSAFGFIVAQLGIWFGVGERETRRLSKSRKKSTPPQ